MPVSKGNLRFPARGPSRRARLRARAAKNASYSGRAFLCSSKKQSVSNPWRFPPGARRFPGESSAGGPRFRPRTPAMRMLPSRTGLGGDGGDDCLRAIPGVAINACAAGEIANVRRATLRPASRRERRTAAGGRVRPSAPRPAGRGTPEIISGAEIAHAAPEGRGTSRPLKKPAVSVRVARPRGEAKASREKMAKRSTRAARPRGEGGHGLCWIEYETPASRARGARYIATTEEAGGQRPRRTPEGARRKRPAKRWAKRSTRAARPRGEAKASREKMAKNSTRAAHPRGEVHRDH